MSVRIDVLIVVAREDFFLLDACLRSITLFSKLSGAINIFLWKEDEYLLQQIYQPPNVIVHYKDNIQELVADDFRNQMYIKLIAHRYISADWVWVVDADYLLCDELDVDDLFDSSGRPYWFYRDWDEGPATIRWKESGELAMSRPIPYLFMDEPQYVLSREILGKMGEYAYADNLLNRSPLPSEFILYGAYAYEYFQEKYNWVNYDIISAIRPAGYKVNQRPPSYCELDESVRLSDLPIAKYYVFWSHWDCAHQKMVEFLNDAQMRKWGAHKLPLRGEDIYIKTSLNDVILLGAVAWRGCYSDGWMKKSSYVIIETEQRCTLTFDFECLDTHSTGLVSLDLIYGGKTNFIQLNPGVTRVKVPVMAQVGGFAIAIHFGNGVKEGDRKGRTLYARVKSYHCEVHAAGYKNLLPRSRSIPKGSVLGINFSGMHDSAIAIVGPNGAPIFACSLERLSRIKQDGRAPRAMLDDIPWDKIKKVGISTDKDFIHPVHWESKLLSNLLAQPRDQGLRHGQPFYKFLDEIPAEKIFVSHHVAHAASAFWGSEFDSALCLVYDGGMNNSAWFGGLYMCDRRMGIAPIDQFSAMHYSKVTSLYTFVTAILGFIPNKHEGKVTGLAASGIPSDACRSLLNEWLGLDFLSIESTMHWVFTYGTRTAPTLHVQQAKIQPYRDAAQRFSREELAATVQEMAEDHVLEILSRAYDLGWKHENICLAGGLFANVKINQRVAESGVRKMFVAPPMMDDGTALGAAWHVLSESPKFAPAKLTSMYLGPKYKPLETQNILLRANVKFERVSDPAQRIAGLLSEAQVVAVFQGATEFGPRSLGNRSILAQATSKDINQKLNQRLNRTDFMPFAPMTRVEDAEACFLNIDRVAHSAEFMTVTVNCTEYMINACPAAVHVDGTARPQLVSSVSNPLMHAILTNYIEKTHCPCLINTSFNLHEEPIVCGPQDALRGFFEAGLDYLYLEGGYLIKFTDNLEVAVPYLLEKIKLPTANNSSLVSMMAQQDEDLAKYEIGLSEKEKVIVGLIAQREQDQDGIVQRDQDLAQLQIVVSEKEKVIVGLIAQREQDLDGIVQRDQDLAQLQVVLSEKEKINVGLIAQLEQNLTSLVQRDENLAKLRITLSENEQIIVDMTSQRGHDVNWIAQRDEDIAKLQIDLSTKKMIIDDLELEVAGLHKDIQVYLKAIQHFRLEYGPERKFDIFKLLVHRVISRTRQMLKPRLGWLSQYAPRPLRDTGAGRISSLTSHPRVSIVTPSYQQGAFIERTIQSVLKQSYPNLQYFVQDGGSSDGTVSVLERYVDQLSGWISRKDSGQAQAINLGFHQTNGDIMAWLNSDDLLMPGALHAVVHYFNRHPEIDVVYGNRLLIDENDMEIGRWILPGHSNDALSWADFIPQESLFWRRRIWDKIDGHVDESFRFAMDWDLLVRFREAGARFGHIPKFLGAFRVHGQQKTSAAINDIGYAEMNRIRERIHGVVPSGDTVRRSIAGYMAKHVVFDMSYRLRERLNF